MRRIFFLIILFSSALTYSLHEGALIIQNQTPLTLGVRIITELPAGEITLDNGKTVSWSGARQPIRMPHKSGTWTIIDPFKTLKISSPIGINPALGGNGTLWGKLTQFTVNQPIQGGCREHTWNLSKIYCYIISLEKKENSDEIALEAADEETQEFWRRTLKGLPPLGQIEQVHTQ